MKKMLAALSILTLAIVPLVNPRAFAQATNSSPAPSKSVAVTAKLGPWHVMKQKLNLTDEQMQRFEPVMREQQAKIAALCSHATLSRQERTARMEQAAEAANVKLRAILSTEQIGKWQLKPSPIPSKTSMKVRTSVAHDSLLGR